MGPIFIPLVCAVLVFVLPVQARAQAVLERIWETTSVINVRQGSAQSERVAGLGRGGFERADGSWKSFEQWYAPRFPEMRFDYMTQLTPNFGILWGVSTGERGQKYAIEPGLKLGAIVQAEIGPAFTIALLGTRMFNNRLREKPCFADYGEIGAFEVNCRLAATSLPPAETLKYLINDRSPERYWLGMRAKLSF